MKHQYKKIKTNIYANLGLDDEADIHKSMAIEMMDDYHKALLLIHVSGMLHYIDSFRLKYENILWSSANGEDNSQALDQHTSDHLREMTHTLAVDLADNLESETIIELIEFHNSELGQKLKGYGGMISQSTREKLEKLSNKFIDEMTLKYDL